jgi:hypothetical protein
VLAKARLSYSSASAARAAHAAVTCCTGNKVLPPGVTCDRESRSSLPKAGTRTKVKAEIKDLREAKQQLEHHIDTLEKRLIRA